MGQANIFLPSIFPEISEWGHTQIDSVSTSNSKARDTYESRRPQVEISPEKQKLASSLLGDHQKPTNHKVSKVNIHASEKPQVPKAAAVHTEVNHEPAPDLLDLGDSTSSTASTVDPFKQLEGLLDQTEVSLTANHGAAGAAKTPDTVGLYADTSLSGLSSSYRCSSSFSFHVLAGLSKNLEQLYQQRELQQLDMI
ncbi:AP-4 complex subunit epsilon [Prunus yedoensis var. nudiflora]|uniref:AP-4 complex subunit epsilon n=1 Tax=Prunus yedoensis var. nudiflora TaxID=2094558 RepID=A0A314Y3N8_PRUYE|nr:AP-4 complex subunit epsilon [Prunus yedoensis var. nudiflora]